MQTTTAEIKTKKKNEPETFTSDEALKDRVFQILMKNSSVMLSLSVDEKAQVWVLNSKVIVR